jgi:hypothetical protein
VVGLELAKMIVDAWLGSHYEGGRHQTRVDAITALEQRGFEIPPLLAVTPLINVGPALKRLAL